MDIDQNRINELVARPVESLNVELKRWINPDEPEGLAKIICAALAIRNRNGGYILIGFDDKTLQPHTDQMPSDVRAAFHLDRIQGIVSKYASDHFEIGVGFGTRDGREHPVIVYTRGHPRSRRDKIRPIRHCKQKAARPIRRCLFQNSCLEWYAEYGTGAPL